MQTKIIWISLISCEKTSKLWSKIPEKISYENLFQTLHLTTALHVIYKLIEAEELKSFSFLILKSDKMPFQG